MARCLIVEDNLVNREIFVEMLAEDAHSIVEAANGREAIDAIDAEEFDLIVLDLHMPEIDGFTVGKHVRASDTNKNAKILVVSAADGSELARTKKEFEADAVVRKPLDIDEFVATSNRLLNP